jgi:hypothetical protein
MFPFYAILYVFYANMLLVWDSDVNMLEDLAVKTDGNARMIRGPKLDAWEKVHDVNVNKSPKFYYTNSYYKRKHFTIANGFGVPVGILSSIMLLGIVVYTTNRISTHSMASKCSFSKIEENHTMSCYRYFIILYTKNQIIQ